MGHSLEYVAEDNFRRYKSASRSSKLKKYAKERGRTQAHCRSKVIRGKSMHGKRIDHMFDMLLLDFWKKMEIACDLRYRRIAPARTACESGSH